MDINSLAHTKWECKYHIVFAPKYRRQVIYKDIKADVGQILGWILFYWLNRRSEKRSYTWDEFYNGLLRTLPLIVPSLKVSLFNQKLNMI